MRTASRRLGRSGEGSADLLSRLLVRDLVVLRGVLRGRVGLFPAEPVFAHNPRSQLSVACPVQQLQKLTWTSQTPSRGRNRRRRRRC